VPGRALETGKSSLVAAGVLPALRKRVSGAMGYLRFTPRTILLPGSPTPSTA
jgi:hypothetical protein